MTSDAQRQANRKNASRSTGPRSAKGKRRVAQNARRHGLAVPVGDDPVLAADVRRLTDLIAGEGADGVVRAAALAFAEAQVDLDRVRRVKVAVLERAGFGGGGQADAEVGEAQVDAEVVAILDRLERYERRAFSRRKRALRAFDAHRASADR